MFLSHSTYTYNYICRFGLEPYAKLASEMSLCMKRKEARCRCACMCKAAAGATASSEVPLCKIGRGWAYSEVPLCKASNNSEAACSRVTKKTIKTSLLRKAI